SDPEIYVRYAPIDAVKMGKALDRRSKQKGESGKVLDDWGIRANADILINSCVGIYMVFSDAPDEKLSLREGDPNGTWTKFDTDLADAMGFDVDRSDAAVSCVRSLYMTDGDLGDATDKLMKFSNMSNGEADEAF
ncbi:hypothetical protein KGP36_08320, partial [Patescibacteria group bacterium]|nr:hypothetical protein [Patescibacteria group bacterium]